MRLQSLVLHHVAQLGHRVRLVVVTVEASRLLILHLSVAELFAPFSTIKQVVHLGFEEVLKIGVILGAVNITTNYGGSGSI